jgi:hypothetical protein
MKNFMETRGESVNSGWLRGVSKYLDEIWDFNKDAAPAPAPAAALVVTSEGPPAVSSDVALCEDGEGGDEEAPPPPPPPPPSSMVCMSQAMQSVWHSGNEIPLVLPLKSTTLGFDRNDLYGKNEAELKRMLHYAPQLGTTRTSDHSLMFVRLTAVGSPRGPKKEYITWCERCHFSAFASQVNHGEVVCNDYVTRALHKGVKFRCSSVCDEIGFLRMRDLDDQLYMLETYVSGFGSRHPHGYNTPDVPHMGSRSLHAMGGNLAALNLYIAWTDAIKLTKQHVRAVGLHVTQAVSAIRALNTWEAQGTDPDLIQSFRVNWETRVQEATEGLAEAEKAYTAVCTTRRKLTHKVVQALADAYVKYTYVHPLHLISLRKTLNKPEPDHVAPVRSRVQELQRKLKKTTMSVRRALVELEMWDGCRDMPHFTRASVNLSFARIARRIHPDKNEGRVVENDEHLEKYQNARNCLHQYIESMSSSMEFE